MPTRPPRSHIRLLLMTSGFLCGHICAVALAAVALTPLTIPATTAAPGIHDPAPPTGRTQFTPTVFSWPPPAASLPAPDTSLSPMPAIATESPRLPPNRRRPTADAEEDVPAEPELDTTPRARARREVRRDDNGVWLIPRDLLMTIANDGALMRTQARRVAPWFEDGVCQGVRVEGAGALLALVGIRDGDIITRAGGIVIDSPHRGLAAWDALRERSEVQIEVLRRGRRVQLRYRLVEAESLDGSAVAP